MGLRDRLRTAALYVFRGEKAIVGLPYGTDASEYTVRTDFETLSKEGYEKNAIVYACINELASSAAEAEPKVEVLTKKGWEERPDHSLKKLLDNPNPEMPGTEFWGATIMYRALAGNMYWEKERSSAKRVVGLWPMRPDRVGIIATKSVPGERVKRRIRAYTWRSGTDMVRLPASEVIPFKHTHPRDDLFGLPPLAAAAREGDTDNKATDYVGSFFTNAAVPKGLLRVEGFIDEAEEKRVKNRLVDMYTGRSGWHDPLVLGEGSEWIELAETFRDMDFPNLRKISETRLCAVWQVPPIMIGCFAGLEKATYSNVQDSRRSFWQDTLMPLYAYLEGIINLHLAPEFGRDVRMVWDFSGVKALQEETSKVWDRANEGVEKGWVMVSEHDALAGDPRPSARAAGRKAVQVQQGRALAQDGRCHRDGVGAAVQEGCQREVSRGEGGAGQDSQERRQGEQTGYALSQVP
jgi:HK97 family phage portal protein